MTYINATRASGATAVPAEERLRGVIKQLEGVFVEQLFKAMRDTVPHDGVTDGGAGEEMFTGLLDQHIAGATPEHWERGLGDALFAQLRPALGPPATPDDATITGATR